MKVSLTKIVSFLFLITLFFIPFDGVGMISFGEFSKEAYIVFLLLFILIYGLTRYVKPISIPKFTVELQLFLLFFILVIFSSVINLPEIFSNEHFSRTGPEKLISQLFVLFFFFPIVLFLFYDLLKNNSTIIVKIRRVFVVALYIVFVVGLLETIYIYYRIPIVEEFLDLIDEIPQVSIFKNHWDKRLSSITKEPPSLGMFLIMVLPWIIALKPIKKSFWNYRFPLIMILFLAIFSNSRSGLVIILLQFIAYGFLKYTHSLSYRKLMNIFKLFIGLFISFIIVFIAVKDTEFVQKKIETYDFIGKYNKSQSNKTRLGTYLASFEQIKNHPIFGSGYGQGGFHVLDKYPDWAVKDNVEIHRYRTGERFPPLFNIYIRILLEVGIAGLIVFLIFLFMLFMKSVKLYYRNKNYFKNYAIIMILSLIGYALTWIQFDTFRVLGFWLFFSFYLYTINTERKYEIK